MSESIFQRRMSLCDKIVGRTSIPRLEYQLQLDLNREGYTNTEIHEAIDCLVKTKEIFASVDLCGDFSVTYRSH